MSAIFPECFMHLQGVNSRYRVRSISIPYLNGFANTVSCWLMMG